MYMVQVAVVLQDLDRNVLVNYLELTLDDHKFLFSKYKVGDSEGTATSRYVDSKARDVANSSMEKKRGVFRSGGTASRI